MKIPILAIAVLGAILGRAVMGEPPLSQVSLQDDRRVRLVGSQKTASGKTLTLQVDSDRRIFFTLGNDNRAVSRKTTLGFEPVLPPESPLTRTVPKGEALLLFRQLSQSGHRIWVGQTVGFRKDESLTDMNAYRLVNRLYVIRQSADSSQVLLTKTYTEIIALDLDDINGDDIIELAISFEGGGVSYSSLLDIWQITDAGKMTQIDLSETEKGLIDGTKTSFRLESYRLGDFFVEREERRAIHDGWQVVRKYFYWEPMAKKYRFQKAVTVVEGTGSRK